MTLRITNQFLLFLFSISILNAQNNIDTLSFNSVINKINFNDKNIVAIGEAHTIRGTHETELFIINKLVEKGYKTIYIEGGEAEAHILSMYMQTGDTSLLIHTRATEWTGAYKKFIKSIYNISLQNQCNFAVRGFDFEHPVCLNYLFSKWFDSTNVDNPFVKHQISTLLSIRGDFGYLSEKEMNEMVKTLRKINDSLPKFESQYKEILGENYKVFQNIISNPVTSDFSTRDRNMTKVALRRVNENEMNKVIFIMGNSHLKYWKRSFIPRLSKALPENYSITTFALIYSHCRYYKETKIYSSKKRSLNYLGKKENNGPLVMFETNKKQIVPSNRGNIMTVLAGLYNQ